MSSRELERFSARLEALLSAEGEAWSPEGFDAYVDHFPETGELALPDRAHTEAFVTYWDALGALSSRQTQHEPQHEPHHQHIIARLSQALVGSEVILARGFLGNWMPGNLTRVARGLRALGADAWIMRSSARHGVEENAATLSEAALKRSRARGDHAPPLIWLGHSKGGLECLLAHRHPALLPRTRAVLMAQSPRGPSLVIESLAERRHQESLVGMRRALAEMTQRAGLHLIGARRGAMALTRGEQRALNPALDAIIATPREYPILQTATWSIEPTTWLDSFHERIGEIAPAVAHDGQFLLRDQLWPGLPHVLLGRVDHAQPAMGGFGFQPLRYWLTALLTGLDPHLEHA